MCERQSVITIVGSINMDIVVCCPRIPREGESLIRREMTLIPGGKDANQAVAVSCMGGQAVMAGKVGNDEFGAKMLASLVESGIDVSNVLVSDEVGTGTAIILVADN